MNSNLPLLFANGFPTSIDKITINQLQCFIPFLVQCSLGHDTTKTVTIPKWWPDDIPMITPDTKPTCSEEQWLKKLKDIVIKCYHFHKCEYLLTFCNDLARHHRLNLRFINNFNGTTSLYIKGKCKLLCTFRNENIEYDKREDSRKFLKPRIVNAIKILDDDVDNEMVTTEAIDIYICEICNVELESLSDMQEHELICGQDKESNIAPSIDVIDQGQTNFLNYLKLSGSNGIDKRPPVPSSPVKIITNSSRRTRSHCDLKKSNHIPFSSPAGRVLLKRANLEIDENIFKEKLLKIEKLCAAPNINEERPKFLNMNPKPKKPYKITFRKKLANYERFYQFPVGHVLCKSKENDNTNFTAKVIIKKLTKNQLARIKSREDDGVIIDLCSSDEEGSRTAINEEKASDATHDSILRAFILNSDKTNNSNETELSNIQEILPLPIHISPSTSNFKIEQILYTENGIMQPSSNFNNVINNECIDLCSSDEESILPDLPSYPHLSIMPIPIASSAVSS